MNSVTCGGNNLQYVRSLTCVFINLQPRKNQERVVRCLQARKTNQLGKGASIKDHSG